MKWIQEYFELVIRDYLRDQYRLLIIDEHISYISIEFIKFMQVHKIICLCFPTHLTHLLQPFDVSIFGTLK